VTAATLRRMDPTRIWWHRLPRMLTRPVPVFEALRDEDEEQRAAREEPILLVILLAGTAALLLTPTWRTLLDDPSLDGVDATLYTFIAGALSGAAGYFFVGLALYLGARGMGSMLGFRAARQLLAFACVPLAASLLVVLPIGVIAFRGDILRSGGSDAGAGGDLLLGVGYAAAAWSVVLLAIGIRVVYGFSWPRVAGTGFMAGVFVAAMVVAPAVL
jgi:hypothetical protein